MTTCDDFITTNRPRLSRKMRIVLFFLVETVAALLIGFAALFVSFDPGWSAEAPLARLKPADALPGEGLVMFDAPQRVAFDACSMSARERAGKERRCGRPILPVVEGDHGAGVQHLPVIP